MQQDPKVSMEAFGALFDPPVHKATVLRWEAGRVPAERVAEIARRTGIARWRLRPDLFSAVVIE
jgi:DNA-binding transcriptional regulator YdaS (Cro superfamily)